MKAWEQRKNYKKFLDGLNSQEAKWKKKSQEIVL
jgi:hypothetical protein